MDPQLNTAAVIASFKRRRRDLRNSPEGQQTQAQIDVLKNENLNLEAQLKAAREENDRLRGIVDAMKTPKRGKAAKAAEPEEIKDVSLTTVVGQEGSNQTGEGEQTGTEGKTAEEGQTGQEGTTEQPTESKTEGE